MSMTHKAVLAGSTRTRSWTAYRGMSAINPLAVLVFSGLAKFFGRSLLA